MNAGTKSMLRDLLPRWILSCVTVWGVLACVGCEKAPNPPAPQAIPQVNTAKSLDTPSPDKPTPSNAPVTPVADPAKSPVESPAPIVDATPRQLLERMVKAYTSARGYADYGFIVQRYVINGQPYEQKQPFSIAYEKPGKLRLECYNVKLLNDGKLVHGMIRDKDGILELAAPATLTQENVVIDETMQAELSRGFGSNPLQLLLLFAADPLSIILGDQAATFLPDLPHQGFNCRRVKITTAAGDLVLWIDARELVLRRLDYPLAALQQELAKQGEIKQLEQYADFVGAELNPKFPPETFQFEVPQGALLVKRFLAIPAPLRPTLLLGKLAPEFQFQSPQGDKITPDALQGKVAVFVFWGSQYQPCASALPLVQQVLRLLQRQQGCRVLCRLGRRSQRRSNNARGRVQGVERHTPHRP
jgi:outer membrane lipoprotein-sorting protein